MNQAQHRRRILRVLLDDSAAVALFCAPTCNQLTFCELILVLAKAAADAASPPTKGLGYPPDPVRVSPATSMGPT